MYDWERTWDATNVLYVHLFCIYTGVNFIKHFFRASLVAQWLRICLPIQGTWVQALAQEDPTCCGATKPVLCNKRSHRNEKPAHPPREKGHAQQRRPNAAKNKLKNLLKKIFLNWLLLFIYFLYVYSSSNSLHIL